MHPESNTPHDESQGEQESSLQRKTGVLKLDWRRLDEIEPRSANLFLAHGLGEEVVLWFGRPIPPVSAAFSASEGTVMVPVAPVASLMIPKQVAILLMQTLQHHLADEGVPADEAVAED